MFKGKTVVKLLFGAALGLAGLYLGFEKFKGIGTELSSGLYDEDAEYKEADDDIPVEEVEDFKVEEDE